MNLGRTWVRQASPITANGIFLFMRTMGRNTQFKFMVGTVGLLTLLCDAGKFGGMWF